MDSLLFVNSCRWFRCSILWNFTLHYFLDLVSNMFRQVISPKPIYFILKKNSWGWVFLVMFHKMVRMSDLGNREADIIFDIFWSYSRPAVLNLGCGRCPKQKLKLIHKLGLWVFCNKKMRNRLNAGDDLRVSLSKKEPRFTNL